MSTATRGSVIGVFTSQSQARSAVDELRRLGFTESQIGVASKREHLPGSSPESDTVDSSTAGATTGAAVGIGGGGLIFAHGGDSMQAKARQVWSGVNTDTATSKYILQDTIGLSRGTANFADAGIGVVGTLGAGLLTKIPSVMGAASKPASLVHLTTAEAAPVITATETLGKGGTTLYAATPSLGEASSLGVFLRTGLLPSQANTAVTISPIATGAFEAPSRRSTPSCQKAGNTKCSLDCRCPRADRHAWHLWPVQGP